MSISMTVLVDNNAVRADLGVEHGYSAWLEVSGKCILFDTGQGEVLAANAAVLGIDLSRAETVVLSHGHYDHTGGLAHVLSLGSEPRMYMHPEATRERYGCLQAPPHKAIGMPQKVAALLAERPAQIVPVTGPMRLADGLWVTGPIPRTTDFEDTGGPFFTDADCTEKDMLTDDQALWLESDKGVIVLLGCAHSGVVNTLRYISRLIEKDRFCSVIGGMHLLNASEERLRRTAEALREFNVEEITPCHCTGDGPMAYLAEVFGGRYRATGAGMQYVF